MNRARFLTLALAASFLAAACGEKEQAAPKQSPPPAPTVDAAPAEPPAPADAAAAAAQATDGGAAAEPPAPAEAPKGEFDAQGKLFYRVAACAGTDPLPARLPAKAIESHCAALDKVLAEYQEKWLAKAVPFLAEIIPDDLPKKVLYPFGGSDLISALAAFPDVEELTIISLEKSGDIRGIDKLPAEELVESLKTNREHLTFLLRSAFHKTTDLEVMTEGGLPSELFDDMVALRVHGKEPVAVRYFRLKDDGTLDYKTDDFTNVEITFRKPGGPLQVYRHVEANLSNGPFKKNAGLNAYMASRAPYTAMTKASSFLLWSPNFTEIRDRLLEQMVFLISDATAPQPADAAKHGFEQIPYGTFNGAEPAFTELDEKKVEKMVELWKSAEKRPCPIRFGYSDINRKPHLLITRKKAAK